MSIDSIEKALEQRDEAIKARLDELEKKHDKLNEKHADTSDMVWNLAQRDTDYPMDGKKAPEYSLAKVMRHLSNPRDNLLDGYEAEMHQEMVRKSGLNRPNAVMVPLSTKTVQADTYSPDLGGGSLIETRLHRDMIDVLREESIVLSMNPTMIQAQGDLDIPRKSAGTTAYWFGADGAAGDTITESTPSFELVQARPKFVAARTKASYKMMIQTGGDIQRILQQDLMATLADAIDLAALQGTGSNYQPTGLLNQSGINTDTWTGSPSVLLWDDVLEMERLLLEAKALKGNLRALCDPTTYKATKTTVKSSGDSVGFLAEPDGMMNNYPLRATTNMPDNTILFGNWNDLIVTTWGAIALEADPYSEFSAGVTGFRAIMPIDFQCRHPASFVKSSKS